MLQRGVVVVWIAPPLIKRIRLNRRMVDLKYNCVGRRRKLQRWLSVSMVKDSDRNVEEGEVDREAVEDEDVVGDVIGKLF